MKPILFNAEMVRAILEDRKTVTRRVVRSQPRNIVLDEKKRKPLSFLADVEWVKPPYQPGDILYVRETWQHGFGGTYLYKADAGHDLFMTPEGELVSDILWRPSIHMPREAARIFLCVTDVRVEKLQSIAPDQLRAEGFSSHIIPSECENKIDHFRSVLYWDAVRIKFSSLWNGTIKKGTQSVYGWDANPWVWVIEFERISREEAHA